MKKLNSYLLTGILFVLITGTLAHFVYEWSGNNFILGFFFPVNESIREHMKLCFFPMLVWSVFADWRLRTEFPCLRTALLAGILVSTFAVPVLFYGYTAILGFHTLVLDIADFIVSVLLGFWCVYRFGPGCRLEEYTVFFRNLVLLTAAFLVICTYL